MRIILNIYLLCHKNISCDRELVTEKYLVISLGQFSPVLHKNICFGYVLDVHCRGASNEYPQNNFL